MEIMVVIEQNRRVRGKGRSAALEKMYCLPASFFGGICILGQFGDEGSDGVTTNYWKAAGIGLDEAGCQGNLNTVHSLSFQ